jgi:methyl-accepting chemotaxis protein
MDKTYGVNRRKRRILLIDRKFQTNFIINFCSLVAVGGLITVGILYLFTMNTSTVSIVNSRVVAKTTADFLLPLLVQTVAVVMVIIGLATVAVTLLVSHKIAGPLYRLKKVLNSLGDGDFSEGFRIRRKDQLQDVADVFNTMIVKLRLRLRTIEKDVRDIKDKAKNISEDDIVEHKKLILKELKDIFSEMEKQSHYFKL